MAATNRANRSSTGVSSTTDATGTASALAWRARRTGAGRGAAGAGAGCTSRRAAEATTDSEGAACEDASALPDGSSPVVADGMAPAPAVDGATGSAVGADASCAGAATSVAAGATTGCAGWPTGGGGTAATRAKLAGAWLCHSSQPSTPAPSTTANASSASSHAGRRRAGAAGARATAGLGSWGASMDFSASWMRLIARAPAKQ